MEALIAALGMLIIGLVLCYLTYKARRNAHQNNVLLNNQRYYILEIKRLNDKLNPNGKEESEKNQKGEADQEERRFDAEQPD